MQSRRDRKAADGFGGCCEPKNMRFAPDGSMYLAESGPPVAVKRFTPEGEFLGVVGLPVFKTGCVRVTVEVARDGRCPRLPERLPETLPVVWKKATTGPGLSGVAAGLKPCWSAEDEAFEDYTSMISDGRRLLIATVTGELVLVAANAESYELLARVQVLERRGELLSHPAVVGDRLYLRDTGSVVCLRLW